MPLPSENVQNNSSRAKSVPAFSVPPVIDKSSLGDYKVRVHAAVLALHPAAKLWYFCRGLDTANEGKIQLLAEHWQQLGVAKSTIYRWLREGEELGLFKRYWLNDSTLKIILGGLTAVCKKAGITNWGTTADDITLEELLRKNNRRALAIALTTKHLQQGSHYSARNLLNKLERRCFEVPTADQLLNSCQTSPKLASGGIRGVVHIGDNRLFVGRSFIPHGVSQARVCAELNSQPTSCGVSRWTMRRHLHQLGVNKRQLMQAKPEYKEITNVIRHGGTSWTCRSNADISFCWSNEEDHIILDEPNGNSSARREGKHRLHLDRLCRYYQATWLHRCNLYDLSGYKLTSMKTTRRKWKRTLHQSQQTPVENSAEAFTPPDPQMNVIPERIPVGDFSGNQNKGSKNDNFQNVETEDISANSEEIPSCWHEMKAKLLQQQQERKQAKRQSLESLSNQPIQDYWAKLYGR